MAGVAELADALDSKGVSAVGRPYRRSVSQPPVKRLVQSLPNGVHPSAVKVKSIEVADLSDGWPGGGTWDVTV